MRSRFLPAAPIHAVLDRHGLVKRLARRRQHAQGIPLSLGKTPNDLWCTDYKLDMKCPAEVYTPSTRPYRGLPELDYPFHDKTIQVTHCERICLHHKKINLSTVFAGQAVGLKEEVEEGIWLVSFMEYDLGYIDLEEKTLQPLDNPFGPKV